jgi:uncharacterized membrane protein YfcA
LDLGALAGLSLAALVAGFIDAIAGGGGLITLPALLIAGLPPAEALATNKLQGTFGVAAASVNFARAGLFDWRDLKLAVAATAVGAALGACLAGHIAPGVFKAIMPFALIAVALYFALAPWLGRRLAHIRLSPRAFALCAAGPVGFYDGIFGPGAGSLYTLAFVTLASQQLLAATARTKLLNFTSNVASLGVFVMGGHVVYAAGLSMALGQVAGAWLGSHTAIAHGARIIRPMVVCVALAIAVKLLADPANPARAWLVHVVR